MTKSSRPIAVAVAALTTMMFGAAALTRVQAGGDFERMLTVAQQVGPRLAARSHQRQPLWGEGRPGSAFAHYDAAQRLLHEATRGEDDLLRRMLTSSGEALLGDPAAMALMARCEVALSALHDGAHSVDATPIGWPEPQRPANLLQARWLMNAAMLSSRVALHRGDAAAAVHRSLDAATLALDLHAMGTLIDRIVGAAMTGIAVSECWPDAALAQLDAPALALLANGLERLDRLLPLEADADAEFWFAQHQCQLAVAAGDKASTLHDAGGRDAVAKAVLQQRELTLEVAAQTDWQRRQARLETAAADAAGIAQAGVAALLNAERSMREAVAAVRLLRLAVEARRGNELPALADPLGDGPLQVTAQPNGSLLLRSVGASATRSRLQRIVAR